MLGQRIKVVGGIVNHTFRVEAPRRLGFITVVGTAPDVGWRDLEQGFEVEGVGARGRRLLDLDDVGGADAAAAKRLWLFAVVKVRVSVGILLVCVMHLNERNTVWNARRVIGLQVCISK